MGNEKAPERIWMAADTPFELLDTWDKKINDSDIEYVRADLLATVRTEEQTHFVNNIASVLDADDVEAFTALIMKAKASPDLNSETRSALKSEAEIRADEREAAFKEAAKAVRRLYHPSEVGGSRWNAAITHAETTVERLNRKGEG